MKQTPSGQKPTVKISPKRFANALIKNDMNGTKAIKELDPEASPGVAAVRSSRMLKNDNVRQAIDDALQFHEATPEFAVGRLKKIAEQEKELGASRLASKDLLELHGWNKQSSPTVVLDVKQAFFQTSRERV